MPWPLRGLSLYAAESSSQAARTPPAPGTSSLALAARGPQNPLAWALQLLVLFQHFQSHVSLSSLTSIYQSSRPFDFGSSPLIFPVGRVTCPVRSSFNTSAMCPFDACFALASRHSACSLLGFLARVFWLLALHFHFRKPPCSSGRVSTGPLQGPLPMDFVTVLQLLVCFPMCQRQRLARLAFPVTVGRGFVLSPTLCQLKLAVTEGLSRRRLTQSATDSCPSPALAAHLDQSLALACGSVLSTALSHRKRPCEFWLSWGCEAIAPCALLDCN